VGGEGKWRASAGFDAQWKKEIVHAWGSGNPGATQKEEQITAARVEKKRKSKKRGRLQCQDGGKGGGKFQGRSWLIPENALCERDRHGKNPKKEHGGLLKSAS